MTDEIFIGIDAGSVSMNIVVMNSGGEVMEIDYRRTHGKIIECVKNGFADLSQKIGQVKISGCGVTGSGRHLVAALVNADTVKNEISAQAAATLKIAPDVKTIIEIGGEDSKIIILRDGIPVDFAMNTMCAAGTGAFLDQLSGRLDIPVENLGKLYEESTGEVAISGRCTVFAESDIIFKQQVGCNIEDIVKGLCKSLVRNYLNDIAKGKQIESPVYFQGGVAANKGIKMAFEEALDCKITIPEYYNVMGAYGAALIAKNDKKNRNTISSMKSFSEIIDSDFNTRTFKCQDCSNNCEIVAFVEKSKPLGHMGGRCGKWDLERKVIQEFI